MSYINQPFNLLTTEAVVVHLDRWSYPSYTVQLDSGTSVTVEGTLDRINRGETPTWAALDDDQGTAIGALAPGITGVQQTPIEAIRITATGTCVGRVMQTGSE